MAQALVVGGTGPTGPHIVSGLLERGHEVTVLHRGSHEIPELDHVEHLHVDPHFRESLDEGIGSRRFDVVIATYGRLRHVAAALAGACDVFVAVSGAPAYVGYHEPGARRPEGLPVPVREQDVLPGDGTSEHPDEGDTGGGKFARSIRRSEQAVLDLHAQGAFSASVFRYPSIYGPRQLYPREWSIIKRVLDGRPFVILPDAGLTITSRCAARNAAEFLLTAVDRHEQAAGEIFNVGDVQQYSLRQWAQQVSTLAGRELAAVSLPFDLAGPGRGLFPIPHTHHGLLSITKAQQLLGYSEAVPAAQALGETVAWLLDNPPDDRTVSGMADAFDYELEDETVRRYHEATAALRDSQQAPGEAHHPYAHPVSAGALDHRGR